MTFLAKSFGAISLLAIGAGDVSAGNFLGDALKLPSETTRQAIESLRPPTLPSPTIKEPLRPESTYTIDPNKVTKDPQASTEPKEKSKVPLAVADSMIIQFQPDVSQSQIDDYLKSHDFEVVDTIPSLGAVKVKTDLSRFFKPDVSDNNSNETVIKGLVAASQEFKKDPRIREATPDLFLHGQADISNFMVATNVLDTTTSKLTDWGIKDIQADQLWSLDGATDGVLFGIMDVGFGKHDDLVYLDPLANVPVEDHGTHVSGIACGRHSNPVGTQGVLPNCFIRARYGEVYLQATQGGEVVKFVTAYSQILSSLAKFVDSYDDVSVFNISLGYNWMSNFGINPDAKESELYRALVEIQGPVLITLLQNAEKKGKVIFSAAGNDSTGILPPIDAKYASPFNWAAINARAFGNKNGIVVEAHDKFGKRAPFSNSGGNISCPGVGILSTVAHDSKKQVSKLSYGEMSGTSMASPYCASGLMLLRLVRQDLDGERALDCILKTKAKTDAGVPMLRLKDALDACAVTR